MNYWYESVIFKVVLKGIESGFQCESFVIPPYGYWF